MYNDTDAMLLSHKLKTLGGDYCKVCGHTAYGQTFVRYAQKDSPSQM